MPTYEFRCEDCRRGFTLVMSISERDKGKISCPACKKKNVKQQMTTFQAILGLPPEQVIRISAKEGTNVSAVLESVIHRGPPPRGQQHQPLRALIFDSHYDAYKGVVAYVRVVDGRVATGTVLRLMSSDLAMLPIEIGTFNPTMRPAGCLEAGEVGYIATGLKNVGECRVGDTFTWQDDPAERPLPGYKPMKSMVFASAYPSEAADYIALREALAKLQLNDASLSFEPETSQALGYGFRCGFLGLFHMEIIETPVRSRRSTA